MWVPPATNHLLWQPQPNNIKQPNIWQYASDFHLPIYLICVSDIQFSAGCNAAPILYIYAFTQPREYRLVHSGSEVAQVSYLGTPGNVLDFQQDSGYRNVHVLWCEVDQWNVYNMEMLYTSP